MNRKLHLFFCFLLLPLLASGQLWNGRDTLYGNEWIRYDQPYYKIPVATDGIYRIPYAALQAAGIAVSEVASGRYQLWRLGEETALYTPAAPAAPLGAGDYLEFYGEQNRSELDRYLYRDPEAEMLNPAYSLFTDTAAYFLTIAPPGAAGRRYRELPNDLTGAPAPEAWYWAQAGQVYTNSLVQETFIEGTAYSHFDRGEGFALSYRKTLDLDISPTARVAAAAVSARFTVRLVARPLNDHQLRISLNNQAVYDTSYYGFRRQVLTFDKPAAALSERERVSIAGLGTNNDHYAVAQIGLTYPRAFDFDNATLFFFPLDGGPGSRYLEIQRFQAGGVAPVLYDLDNGLRWQARLEGGVVKVQLPAAAARRRLALVNPQSGVKSVEQLTPASFIDYTRVDAEYVIISNRRLYDDGQGNNWVGEYAAYRRSPEGGGFRTEVVEIQQLYDQFAYGIQRHPLSVRNFAHFIRKRWTQPRYVLLIGKAREYPQVRTAAQLANPGNASFHVPTLGAPGSDNLLLASNDSQAPVLPVGRIPAATPEDVRIYLEKIREYDAGGRAEAEDERAWRKEIIHLGGGGGAGEQQIIRNALGRMENVIRGGSFGGNVFSFYKTSLDPIQQAESGLINGRINNGTAILTFFGHSGPYAFDFSLDDPSTYRNQGRYPVMFSLGCLSGQVHLSSRTVGERFVFQDQRGAIAFLATVGLGTIPNLELLTAEFYRLAAGDYYGRGIGDILRGSLARYDGDRNLFMSTLVQQFTLNGDPAAVITPYEGPDYRVDASSVQFEPKVLTAQQDSFRVSFALENLGKSTRDSFYIEIRRQFPDGSEVLMLRERIAGSRYRDEMSFQLPVFGERSIGFNRIFIQLDPDDEVSEFPVPVAKENNELVGPTGKGIGFYVFANGIIPVSPAEFAIVNQASVTLKATSSNSFADVGNYLFELDTTQYFNSPLRIRHELSQIGGLVEWTPDAFLLPGVTYYWRVSLDSTDQFGYVWSGSSFTCLPDTPTGWTQTHFFQFQKNRFVNKEYSTETRKLKFIDDLKQFKVRNGVYPAVDPTVDINTNTYFFTGGLSAGVVVYVLDSITVEPWQNAPPGQYGSINNAWLWPTFPFKTATLEDRKKVIAFLRDSIPSGNYVLLYTIQQKNTSYLPEQWTADSLTVGINLFTLLEEQGAREVRRLAQEGAKPYLFMYKKDDPDFPRLERLVEPGEVIEEDFPIYGIWDRGSMESKVIGPARQWGRLVGQVTEVEPNDTYGVDVFGVRPDSTVQLLVSNLTSLDTSLSWIDAEEYPLLRLVYSSEDPLFRSAPQLNFWRVYYEGMADAAIDPSLYFSFHADTLQKGDLLRLQYGVQNLGAPFTDSLRVRYTIRDLNNNVRVRESKLRPLGAGDTTMVSFQAETTEMDGQQELVVEINPDGQQPEVTLLNNIGVKPFFVGKDDRNPLLDVTFDGQHILNGDLVSSRPFIVVTLEDDNRFLPLNDTSTLKILIKSPGANDVSPVWFNSNLVRFYPASTTAGGGRNRASVEFMPYLSEDGIYTLIVQGQDMTGNQSGKFDYKVNFEVINETRLSNVFNYPNPFSTSTRFVYTLTGEEAPAHFVIQIMTISGRVVRELTQADLGTLKIGTHQTEFAWDGTDEFGDKLANGVYLYRIIARDADGNRLEKHDNGTDRFFKQGIGKLVILR